MLSLKGSPKFKGRALRNCLGISVCLFDRTELEPWPLNTTELRAGLMDPLAAMLCRSDFTFTLPFLTFYFLVLSRHHTNILQRGH